VNRADLIAEARACTDRLEIVLDKQGIHIRRCIIALLAEFVAFVAFLLDANAVGAALLIPGTVLWTVSQISYGKLGREYADVHKRYMFLEGQIVTLVALEREARDAE